MVEHPANYVDDIPFVQIFMGDVHGSTIMQAREIRVESGFLDVFRKLDEIDASREIRDAVTAIEQETRKKAPEISRIKDLLQKVKADDRIFAILAPVVTKAIEKIVLG